MAEIIYNAFLSCSINSEDQTIVDFFKKMIASFKITPLVYDYQEIGNLTEKIKTNIAQSDCLIAIITRRDKIEGSDLWAGPSWIQHEIALAHAFNKPIAIFVESGVKVDGLIEMEERRNVFDRDNIVTSIDKISSFLFSLRKYLEVSQDQEAVSTPIMLKHYVHAKQEMKSKQQLVERTEILMESLIDGLESAFHKVEVEEMTENLSVKPDLFEFRCLENPSSTKVEHEVLMNKESIFSWKINFHPPLKKGEKVKYTYKKIVPFNNPYSYEELIQRIENQTYEYKEPKCEACEWTIRYPTYELQHEFEFPENYEVTNFFPDVQVGAEKLKAEYELKRVIDGEMFKAEKVFDKWVLKIKILKPQVNHKYYIYYVPPKNPDGVGSN